MSRFLIGVLTVSLVLIGATPAAAAASTCAPELASGATPTLTQTGTTWQATVLVDGIAGTCPSPLVFTLEATTPAGQVVTPQETIPTPPSSQEVSVRFPLTDVPTAATLLMTTSAGDSSTSLTVSRQVSPRYYFGIPAACGLLLALLLLIGMLTVPLYDERRPGRRLWPFGRRFLSWTLTAGGAWAASDSWATNIGTVVAIASAITSLSTSAAAFLPGVALDQFGVLFIAAGGVIAAAPLVFAVQYARWSAKMPGVTCDATVWLPVFGPQPPLLPGTRVDRLSDRVLTLEIDAKTTFIAGTIVVLPTTARLTYVDGGSVDPVDLAEYAQATIAAKANGMLPKATTCTLSVAELVGLPDGDDVVLISHPTGADLFAGAQLTLHDGRTATLDGPAPVTVLSAAAELDPDVRVQRNQINGVRPQYTRRSDVDDPGYVPARIDALTQMDLMTQRFGPAVRVHAQFGSSVTLSSAATLWSMRGETTTRAQLPANQAIQIPSDCDLRIVTERVALPGGTDLVTEGPTLIAIRGHEGLRELTISSDRTVPLPVLISTSDGARISAADSARVRLPEDAVVLTPGRKPRTVTAKWPLLTLTSAGGDLLVGTLRMVIVSALVTVFGIGAEMGLTLSLIALSDVSSVLRITTASIVGVIGLFLLYYSVTAIRTLADPQPGSSLSSVAGTSFTL